MSKKAKNVVSFIILVCVFGSLSLSAVKAVDFFGDYDFILDFSMGNPYDYSYSLDKTIDEPAAVSSNSSSEKAFTVTVLPASGYDGVEHTNVTVKPGETVSVPVPWYNKPCKAVLRGESNYDTAYRVSGFWMADPSYVPHE